MKQQKKYKGVFLDKKTGKYYVATTFTTKDGYQIKKMKRGFDTAKKAELWKNQTALEYANNSYTSITGGKVGIPKLIDDYVQYRKATLKPSTLIHSKRYLNKYFAPYFNYEAKDIQVKDIINFYNALADNPTISNSTKNIVITFTKSFVEYLDTIEAITVDIYRKFKKILQKFDTSIDKKEVLTFEKNEVYSILEAVSGDTQSDRMYHLLFNILAFTGCRIAEALALKIEDLNLEDNTLYFYKQVQTDVADDLIGSNIKYEIYRGAYVFYHTKANTTKRVVIPGWLKDEILAYYNDYPRAYIFVSVSKKILNRSTIDTKLSSILTALDLPKRNIHSFRHFHTSQLYEMGLDPKYIAERLGHTDETTSMKVYKHLSKEKIESENAKLLEFIS